MIILLPRYARLPACPRTSTVCRSKDFMLTLGCFVPIFGQLLNTARACGTPVTLVIFELWNPYSVAGPNAYAFGPNAYGLSSLENQSRLRALNLYSVQGRLLRADMIQCWKMFHAKCAVSPTDLFTLAPQSATRGHRFKVCHPRPQSDVRKRSFSVRCVGYWNALPDCVVMETDYKTFKVLLAETLGDALYDFQP